MIEMHFILGLLLFALALFAAIVAIHPRWREGPVMRLGLVVVAASGVVAPELLIGGHISERAMVNAWATHLLGLALVIAGWGVRVMLRGNPQRRTTDHGAFDPAPHHHARRAEEA